MVKVHMNNLKRLHRCQPFFQPFQIFFLALYVIFVFFHTLPEIYSHRDLLKSFNISDGESDGLINPERVFAVSEAETHNSF